MFEEKIDPRINARCVSLAADVERRRLAGVRDVVPAYHTVSVYFDPRKITRSALHQELGQAMSTAPAEGPVIAAAPVHVSVTYGGESGPDLASVAAFASCSEDEVIRLHTEKVYRAYMLGFLPGFAYLGSVDPRIAMPRLGAPRLRFGQRHRLVVRWCHRRPLVADLRCTSWSQSRAPQRGRPAQVNRVRPWRSHPIQVVPCAPAWGVFVCWVQARRLRNPL